MQESCSTTTKDQAQRVTVRRIIREWAHDEGEDLANADYDRLIAAAVSRARGWQ